MTIWPSVTGVEDCGIVGILETIVAWPRRFGLPERLAGFSIEADREELVALKGSHKNSPGAEHRR